MSDRDARVQVLRMARVRFQVIVGDDALPEDADSHLHRFHAYWRSKCRGGEQPVRRDMDPIEIAPLLPSVFLIDVEDDDFRFSLVGQRIVTQYGNLKGKTLGELMTGPELEQTLDEHRRCVTSRFPVYTQNTKDSARPGDWRLYERLLAPLVTDSRVTALAGVMVFRSYRP
jgi:hypothetical protein